MIKVKFCGLTREEDIRAANLLKPDFIGVVFAEKSKRFISPEKAALLKSILLPSIKAVGVFVNAEQEVIADIADKGIIDMVQLHGDEDDTYIETLRKRTNCPIIKAIKAANTSDIAKAQMSVADLVLLDGGAGDGKTFDWDLLNNISRPYFLAGGLTPENIGDVVKKLSPYALDVSTGIETAGHKDPQKMKLFMQAQAHGA